MNRLIFLLVSLFTVTNDELQVQDLPELAVNEAFCGFDHVHDDILKDEDYQIKWKSFEKKLRKEMEEENPQKMILTLPVVVHIIHDGGPENIDDAQVIQGIEDLNVAFANAGYYEQGSGVNTEIQFCLARRDPNGNITNGITRDQNALTDMILELDDIDLKDINRWNPLEYINIWLVSSITSNIAGPGVAGYAFFPASHGQPEDGIVMESSYFGSSQANSSVTAHEMGHYLGLYHTFEGGCTNNDCTVDGDRVCDTPPDQTTGNVPCDLPPNSCNTDTDSGFLMDVDDMIQNFMDYSALSCYHDFTQDQTNRMRFVAENTRVSLLEAKSCDDPCLSDLEAVIALDDLEIEVGSTLIVPNQSTNATEYEWSIDELVISQDVILNHLFNEVGEFKLVLTAFNDDENCISHDTICISVFCPLEAGFTFGALYPEIGSSQDFTNTGTIGASYEWTVNGFVQANTADYAYDFDITGYFVICQTVYNDYCDDTECQEFLVIAEEETCEKTFIEKIIDPGVDLQGISLTSLGDGSLLLCGAYDQKGLIAQTTESGELLEVRTIDLHQSMDQITSVGLDSEGMVYGSAISFPVAGQRTPYFFRYDPNSSSFIWIRRLNVIDVYTGIIEENGPGGNYLVGGQYNDGSPEGCNALLVEVDRNTGIPVWQREFHLGSCEHFGDVVSDGQNIYGTGRYNFAGGGTAKMRIGITKMDLLGNQEWSRLYVVPVNPDNARIYSSDLLIDDQNLVVVGNGDTDGTSATDIEGIILKTDLDGNAEWVKIVTTPEGQTVRLHAVQNLPDGYIIAGSFISNLQGTQIIIFRVDNDGNLEWSRKYGMDGDESIARKGMIVQNGQILLIGTASEGLENDLYFLRLDIFGKMSSECEEIEDVQLFVDDYQNPYDGEHTMSQSALFIGSEEYALDTEIPALESEPICRDSCPEICDNGIDDDGDGYIDCYDTECPCLGEDCSISESSDDINARLSWQSTVDRVSIDATPIIGNLNPASDSTVEIIVLESPANITNAPCPNLLFFEGDGANADDPHELNIPFGVDGYSAVNPVIGDVDGNGVPELLIVNTNSQLLVYTNYDPNSNPIMELMVTSPDPVDHPNRKPYLADFNGDGISEVYVGDDIYEFDFSLMNPTLTKVLSGGSSAGLLNFGNYQQPNCSPIAVDLLSPIHCAGDPDCDGIELAAGNIIYSVDMTGLDGDGYEIKIQRDLNQLQSDFEYLDGYTSSADVNHDGILDVVVAATRDDDVGVYVWDRDGLIQWFPHETDRTGGVVSIANVYDDTESGAISDLPEILVCSVDRLYAYNLNAADQGLPNFAWWKQITTDGSGMTSTSVFDFNGDGIAEILYRDMENLRIMYGGALPFPPGVDAERNWDVHLCGSGTFDEFPVTADIDGDLQAEIIVTGYTFPGPNNPPADYRGRLQVYEADLNLSGPWMPARQVWNQYAYFGLNVNDDLTIPVEQQKHHLEFPSLGSNYRPFNQFIYQLPFFDEDYQSYLPVPDATISVDSVICDQDSLTLILTICNQGAAILTSLTPIMAYDDDPTAGPASILDSTSILEDLDVNECTTLEFTMPFLEGDIYLVVNDNGSLLPPFDLDSDFPVTDYPECDYSNNLGQISFDLEVPDGPDLGPDTSFCADGIFVLDAGPGWHRYEWFNGESEQTITVFEAGEYYVTVYDICGNPYSDTIIISQINAEALDALKDTIVCGGESIELSVDGFDEYQWAPMEAIDCPDCPDVTVQISDTTLIQLIAVLDGCVSYDSMWVFPSLAVSSFDTLKICDGDTIMLFGENVFAEGDFQDTVASQSSCDSVIHIRVELNSLPSLEFEQSDPCPDEANGSISAQYDSTMSDLIFEWSVGGNQSFLNDLQDGSYSLTVTDENQCQEVFDFELSDLPFADFDFIVTSESCLGQGDGGFEILNLPNGYETSLDGLVFTPGLTYSELESGDYTVFIRSPEQCIVEMNLTITAGGQIDLSLPAMIELSLGDSAFIVSDISPPGDYTYTWTPEDLVNCPSCPDVWVQGLSSTTLTLIAIDSNGCEAQASTTLIVDDRKQVYPPNVFSPNSDGINDIFTLYSDYKAIQMVYLRVYNRWGSLIFETAHAPLSDPTYGWDGTFKGQESPTGVYIWSAEVLFIDGEEKNYSGDINLIR